MRVYHLPSVVIVLAASTIEAGAIDVVHRSTYQGIRAAESVETTSVPSAAPTIHPSVQKVSTSSAPSSADPAASDNSMSINSATASDSASVSGSLQDEIEEEKSGIFGMSLFQTCAAFILIAMIVGLVGHFGMKLLPYNRRRREDNARRNDVRIEDSLASFRSIPRASSSSYVGNNIQLQDSLDSFRSNVGV